jgi:hypothetical protein
MESTVMQEQCPRPAGSGSRSKPGNPRESVTVAGAAALVSQYREMDLLNRERRRAQAAVRDFREAA